MNPASCLPLAAEGEFTQLRSYLIAYLCTIAAYRLGYRPLLISCDSDISAKVVNVIIFSLLLFLWKDAIYAEGPPNLPAISRHPTDFQLFRSPVLTSERNDSSSCALSDCRRLWPSGYISSQTTPSVTGNCHHSRFPPKKVLCLIS